jgi:G6PDH family F420-dependent oxidoreductase
MPVYGYFLASEEHDPAALVEQARMAEQAGFRALWVSDHFHPWNDAQGQSPFVWSVIGALSEAVSLPIETAVTCPTVRMHPAVTAQAAATSAVLTEGRFRLGVGTGEALNEHILGDRWPPLHVRLEMLEEAVQVMRRLFTGEEVNHQGTHYTVENARLYTVPDEPVPIDISGFGPKATSLAARVGDGYITMAPEEEMVTRFLPHSRLRSSEGTPIGRGRDETGQRRDEGVLRRRPRGVRPQGALALVQRAAARRDGPGAALAAALRAAARAGHRGHGAREGRVRGRCRAARVRADGVRRCRLRPGVRQIGADQRGFFDFYRTKVLPRLG